MFLVQTESIQVTGFCGGVACRSILVSCNERLPRYLKAKVKSAQRQWLKARAPED